MLERGSPQRGAKEVWSAGDPYEFYVGRWSRLVGKQFLAWLSVPAQRDWLDVGCGSGALTENILHHADPNLVKGIDSSVGFIEHAKARIAGDSVSFQIGDAQSLPVDTAGFDVVVTGLMLNFVANPLAAVQEMARAVRSGGIVGAYVWDYAGEMQMIRHFWSAVAALDPAAANLDEGRRFPMCRPAPLVELFRIAPLDEVDVRSIDITTRFRDFDDYWSPFLSGQGPAPGYAVSLTEDRRSALREHIRSELPVAQDGSITLIARAWAVRGRKL